MPVGLRASRFEDARCFRLPKHRGQVHRDCLGVAGHRARALRSSEPKVDRNTCRRCAKRHWGVRNAGRGLHCSWPTGRWDTQYSVQRRSGAFPTHRARRKAQSSTVRVVARAADSRDCIHHLWCIAERRHLQPDCRLVTLPTALRQKTRGAGRAERAQRFSRDAVQRGRYSGRTLLLRGLHKHVRRSPHQGPRGVGASGVFQRTESLLSSCSKCAASCAGTALFIDGQW